MLYQNPAYDAIMVKHHWYNTRELNMIYITITIYFINLNQVTYRRQNMTL